MNQRLPRQSVFHTLLSALTRKAPEQARQQVKSPRHPTLDDRDDWHSYWKEQGQAWRTEPEIDLKRQADLARRRVIVPDIKKGIYPFKGMKLSRADVEWLLATHENGCGPVDGSDETQYGRQGLDLRGANLRSVDLRRLPLAGMQGGLTQLATEEQCEAAAAHLENVNLGEAHLERASFLNAHMEGANLSQANLREANLTCAHLEEASLHDAHLEGASFYVAHLERAGLIGAYMERADLREAHLERAILSLAYLDEAFLGDIILGDEKHIGPYLADVRWGIANLAVVKWSQVTVLGDEYEARQKKRDGRMKERHIRLSEYEEAVRANRQLAIVLQAQGLNRDAIRFAYRAQVLEKTVFRLQMLQADIKLRWRVQSCGAWLFSWFIFLLAGYGYKPGRSFLAYLLVISTFMVLYLLLDPHLAWYEAIVVSMTAFHGRGFSPSTFSLGDPLSIASAIEAFVGLIIEVTFIATLTRRFFGQ